MTYCVGIKVAAGLVLISDTRTSAAFDDVKTYTKTHRFKLADDRQLVLMSAGNLATTQALLARLQRDLDTQAALNLNQPRRLFALAEYIGQQLVAAQQQIQSHARHAIQVEASLILGGQIRGTATDLILIYPQGNVLAVSPETPYLQLGEAKYGKPLLDQLLTAETSLEDAARIGLLACEATLRCNLSVGLPLDLSLLAKDRCEWPPPHRIEADSAWYQQLCADWARHQSAALQQLPRFPWEAEPGSGTGSQA